MLLHKCYKCHHCGEMFDKELEFFLFKLWTAFLETRDIKKVAVEFELMQ